MNLYSLSIGTRFTFVKSHVKRVYEYLGTGDYSDISTGSIYHQKKDSIVTLISTKLNRPSIFNMPNFKPRHYSEGY